MKQMRYLLVLALLMNIVLTGCGGGGGSKSVGTRTVTISFSWPDPTQSKAKGRYVPSAVRSAVVEIYDGTTPIGTVNFTRASNTVALAPSTSLVTVPAKGVTFYANAYADTTAPGYTTNPTTGATNAPANDAPLAHAVSVIDFSVPNPPTTVPFAMNNTIARISGINGSNLDTTTLTLDVPSNADNPGGTIYPHIRVADTITAYDAQGNILLQNAVSGSTPTDKSTFTAAYYDPANPVETKRITFTPDASTLILRGTGTVRLKVTDAETSGTQQPIQTQITYTVQPKASTSAVNATLTGIPPYAKSVTLTVRQVALDASLTSSTADTLPADVGGTIAVASTTTPALTSTLTTDSNNHLSYTGRTVVFWAQAWSGANGTGTVLATNSVKLDYATLLQTDFTNPANLTINLLPTVTAFAVKPSTATITLTNPPGGAPGLNTAVLHVTPLVNSVVIDALGDLVAGPATGIEGPTLDPRTLTVTSSATSVATTSLVTTSPDFYIQVTAQGTAGTATITAKDVFNKQGTATVTTSYNSPDGSIIIR